MSERDPRQDTPIAVVGVSALFPGSTNARGFWRDILAGRDLIQDVPPSHWRIEDYYDPDPKRPDYTYARRGAFLDKVAFEPMAFGVPPNIIPATDTSQLLALIVAQRVLEDATQGQFAELDRERVSVILGVTSAQELLGAMVSRLQHPVWRKALRETGLPESQVQEACERLSSHYVDWQESTFPGLLGNVVAGRIANRFDLHGTNCVTDAACASTFSALSMAVNELALGHSDMVITGGVDTMNDIFMFMCFSKTTALSLSGDCRPFSDQADGTMLGEGIGMVALRRLEDAERDGDKIYAVLNAVGSSSDGRAKSIYAPVSSGQARALRRAYERAGYGPETVELVEAHGTGTKAGDAAEFEGLRMVFDEADDQRRQWCTLGSVKSQVGHTKSAAGAAGLFKAIMALHHKVLPPTIKIDRPNSLLRLTESPFALSLKARPWIRGSDHPRRASVSSFGFGGTNFHLALEEYTGEGTRAERLRTTPAELVLFGAETPEALIATLRGTEIHGEDCLGWMARHSQENLNPAHPARVAIVAHDDDELTQRLEEAARLIERDPRGQLSSPKGIEYAWQADPGEVAFLFPGQGSQYLHMGAEVAMHFDDALSPWDTAADLHFDDTHRLHDVVFPATAFDDEGRQAQTQRLISTEWAQPAIGATSMSLMTLLSKLGVAPAMVGGHSFGEVTALHAAGALDAATALRVARRRGELMRDAAAQPGAMSAVSATIEKVRPVIDALDGDVVVANHNAPEQVVISGPTDQVSLAEDKLKAAGLRVKRLPVATAFHSSVVSESSAPFAEFLADVEVQTPTLPVYANAQAAPYPAEPQNIRQQLAAQLASPVRFVEQIEAMHDAGARTFVEVGPGSVLTGLTRRILGERPHRAVSVDRKGASGVESFFKAIGALWVAGLTPDFAALWADIAPRQDPRTVQAPRLAVDIDGTNYGKSYPTADDSNLMPPPNPEVEPDVIIKEVEVVKEVPVVQEIVKEVVKEVPVEVRVEVPVPSAAPANGYAPSNPTAAAPLPGAPQAAWSPAAAADHSRMAWLRAYQEVQRQTAEAHAAFQAGMAQSHAAYLQAAEASMHQLGALTQNTAAPQGYAQPTAAYAQPSYVAQPQINAQPTTTAPLAAPAPTSVVTPQPAPVATRATSTTASPALNAPATPQATAPVAKAKPTPAPPKAAAKPAPVAKAKPAIDLEALLLNVVADKTGYPADMLSLDMNLEADLGVDSIKRVEILSAMTEQAPGLPEVDTGEMASMQTLGQIVDYMSALAPDLSATAVAPAPATASAPAIDLEALLLNVVADKTGYPADMLSLDMNLEADLGVDSIKRVEILSAMTEQAPGLPEVDTGEMAAMQTLGQIVDYMRALTPGAGAAPASTSTPPVAPAPAAASTPAIDLEALLLNVVADKTGYPADMLSLDMNLEADLGVDSIKRVEILSAMTEQAPGLPEVDTGEMAAMQTLGQIVDYMRALTPEAAATSPGAPSATTAAAPAAQSAAAGVDLEALLLNVVADKTGYPADMLSLDMNLEADLGVDSIKRVEILSAMTEQAPGLPEVDTGEMAAMQTLGQIVDYMSALAPQSTAAPQSAPVTSPATASVAPAAASAPAIDLKALLLNVVADKTGYPADMLSLDMDLEADLGVDSIKRVEILSAMTDQAPDLPEVDTGEMAAMQTLGQIVDYMRGQLGGATGGEPSAATTAANLAPSAASAPSIDLEALLLNVVADKTGYPADMLSLDMDLEADLGVDSIKRVEILSSMTEQAPDLPEVDTGEMAAMQTLGQIVDYMRGQLGGATSGEATQSSTEASQAKPSGPTLGRFVLSLEEVTAPGLTAPSFTKVKRAVVTSDGGGVAEALVARLGQLGVEASISNTPGDADAVFFLGGLKDFEWADAALEIQREAFEFARAAAATMRERGGLFVTVQDTGGDFGTSGDARAWIGGIGGLTKTVAQEWPEATVKALDVERGERDADAVAEIILQECLEGGAELEVAFDAEGTRRVPRSIAQAAVTQGSVAVTPGQVIVVSGGARGVTATTLFALAKAAQPRFVLLGRSPIAQEPASCQGVEDDAGLKRALLNDARARGEKPKPAEIGRQVRRIQAGREIRATLATLKAAGSKARYDAVDVRDAEALSALLEDVRATWGPVAGVIHGAGVLADKLIGDKTDAQFDAVFSTKVAGLRALLAATASDPLALLVMFSSIAARTGNAGQSDYAMANETLNKVAALEAKRRGDACLVRSLGWGPWEGGMVTPALKARFEALGVALIPHAEGAQMMVDELRGDVQGATEIVLGATPRFRPLLSGDDDRGEAHFDLLVHEVTHPYLADHTVRDVPVVPVVMVMEWFSRAARALAPTLNVVACRDIKVLQGVRLERFSESGDRYQIHCRRISNGTGLVLGLELRGLDGRRHYSATVEMARQAEEAPKVDLGAAPKGLQAWRGPLYNTTTLFHGPDFQVIREMDGVSDEGLSGELEGSAARGWPSDDRWCNDVAALDGGLQMAVLWTHHKLGGDSLPTQVGALRTYSPGFVKGPISCTIQSRRVGRSRIVCDVRLVGADGRLVAEMNDVETHLLPS